MLSERPLQPLGIAACGLGLLAVLGAGVALAIMPALTLVGMFGTAVALWARAERSLLVLGVAMAVLIGLRGTEDPTLLEAGVAGLVLGLAVMGAFDSRGRLTRASRAATTGLIAVGLSSLVALVSGHAVLDIARDASPYVLLVVLPLASLVLPATERGIRLVGAVVTGLVLLSFVSTWLANRGISPEFVVAQWVLPSFAILLAATAYLSVRMTDDGSTLVVPVGSFILLIGSLALTGTRVSALLLLGPLIAALTRPHAQRSWRRSLRAASLIVVCSGVAVVVVRGYVPESAVNLLQSRASSLQEVLEEGIAVDQSAVARMAATETAVQVFAGSPVVGSGLGVPFVFSSPYGHERRSHSDFTIDSSVATLAKFGLLGSLLMLLSVVLLVRALTPAGTRARRVGGVIGVLGAVYAPFLPLLEDKGLGLALLLLVLWGQAQAKGAVSKGRVGRNEGTVSRK